MALGRMTAVCLLALLVSFVTVGYLRTPVEASLYFNSSEPGCDGSDPNVLWCDDFERGTFFKTFGDRNNPGNAGWSGTDFPPRWCQLSGGLCLDGAAVTDPTGNFMGRCGNQTAQDGSTVHTGAAGTNCAGYQGYRLSTEEGQLPGMADHNLASAVSEIYYRFYVMWTSYTVFTGNNKIQFTVNQFVNSSSNGAGIYFGASFAGGGGSTADYHFYAINSGTNFGQNQGNELAPGANNHWYFIERHIKLNTPGVANGVFEMWINDCGTDGKGCTGTPTLRMQYTNVQYVNSGDNSLIGNLWAENYTSGVGPFPGEAYIDQIKVSKVGPIGFMASAGPVPSVPTRTSLSSIGVASIVVALLVFPALARRRGRWLPHRAESKFGG